MGIVSCWRETHDYITLADNYIEEDEARAVFEALAINTSLTELKIPSVGANLILLPLLRERILQITQSAN